MNLLNIILFSHVVHKNQAILPLYEDLLNDNEWLKGEVTERPKVHASKACELVTAPRVRISASPPEFQRFTLQILIFSCFVV